MVEARLAEVWGLRRRLGDVRGCWTGNGDLETGSGVWWILWGLGEIGRGWGDGDEVRRCFIDTRYADSRLSWQGLTTPRERLWSEV